MRALLTFPLTMAMMVTATMDCNGQFVMTSLALSVEALSVEVLGVEVLRAEVLNVEFQYFGRPSRREE
jgi:hypothetical protein